MQNDLFYPDVSVQIGRYDFTKGITIRTYSDGDAPMDWGKISFTEPYQDQIKLADLDEVIIRLGYDGNQQEVFLGNLVKPYHGTSRMDEIIFKDKMLMLEKTKLQDTFLQCTPQDIIKEGLEKAGVTDYKLSDITYPQKAMVPVTSKSMVQVLKQINAVWGISVQASFIKGIFYWGVIPEQTEILTFEYANNILSLDRAQGMWQLITVSIPSMQHSQLINVIHPKITGTFTVKKVIFETNDAGFIRTQLYFKGD